MDSLAATFDCATSSAFLNKERLGAERGTWKTQQHTIESLLERTKAGEAHTAPLATNVTHSPSFAGEVNPALGPFMRDLTGNSERLNANALPTALICLDLDGDTTLEAFLATNFAKTRVLAVATSARHLRVEVDGVLQHRLRVYLLADEAVELFFDDPEYRNPFWLLEEVRKSLITELCNDLGIENIKDESGKDPARIFYGNTGPSQPIGNGDERPAGEQQHIILGNRLPDGYVASIFNLCIQNHLTEETDVDIEDLPVGTPKQLKDAAYILGNNILSDRRAADYHEWIRLLHAVKKLDPSGDTLLEPFLKFSQQSSEHDPSIEDILERLEMLPNADDIFIGITALRDAATEDTPDWQAHCPKAGRQTQSVEAAGFIGTAIHAGPMVAHIQKMYQLAGQPIPSAEDLLPAPEPVAAALPKTIQSNAVRPTNARSLLGRQPRVNNNRPPHPTSARLLQTVPQATDNFNGYDDDLPESTLLSSSNNSDF